MRFFLILVFLVSDILVFGQRALSSLKRNPDIYVFNNSKDTIYLTKVELGQWTITQSIKIVDTVQIDGLGSSEIIFARTIKGSTEKHGGTFDISESEAISKYEIWNIDTKTLVFEAINSLKFDRNNFNSRYTIPDSLKGLLPAKKGNCSYVYDFSIDRKGLITIKNLKKINTCMPDKQEGLYRFINGKYINE